MADVFISYHESSAGELAAQIADILEASGISCWYARRDLPSGGDFARMIPPKIDACKVFLLILDKNAQNSKHIESELGLAFRRSNRGDNIVILPLELGDFKLETWMRYYLVHTQSVRFPAKPDKQSVQELVRRIVRLLNRDSAQLPMKIVKRGECGDNVGYTMDDSGALEISGNGPMGDYTYDKSADAIRVPWWNERKKIQRVRIQNGVTSIGEGAFSNCVALNSVSIPDSVTSIKDMAFYHCTALTNVTLPDTVTSIGASAFDSCANLTMVSIPDSVAFINRFAFSDCARLTSVSVPAHTKINIGAFPYTAMVTRRT